MQDPWEFITPLGLAIRLPMSLSTAGGVIEPLPGGPSTSWSEGFPHYGRKGPEQSCAGAACLWIPQPSNPKGPFARKIVNPREGPCFGS
ncbi:unnamed protein product [Schistocephalus solidus]|uniref:Uncharacterized protein n=1 Tax=Schistocephalus solidus TaxID=70667 RepID=A0A3P7D3G9_SCHSO|nr:unnamed protein product [Schistocephalus solidus]